MRHKKKSRLAAAELLAVLIDGGRFRQEQRLRARVARL